MRDDMTIIVIPDPRRTVRNIRVPILSLYLGLSLSCLLMIALVSAYLLTAYRLDIAEAKVAMYKAEVRSLKGMVEGLETVATGQNREIESLSQQVRYLAEHFSAPRDIGLHLRKLERLSEYQTRFDPEDEARIANLSLAAHGISGVVVHPRQVFSFNRAVGPRTEDRGYRPAAEIVHSEFVEGIGGGICQVSTTLYNAVLLADLPVLERHPHSVPVSYVAQGRDAAVAYDYLDLRFENSYDYPILIIADAVNDTLTVHLYGMTGVDSIVMDREG